MNRKIFSATVAYTFVCLFLYTAISKLKEFAVFREQLTLSAITEWAPGFIAWALILTECVVAVLLFVPVTRTIGMYAAFFLMITFTLYVALLLMVSKELPCSCGGILEHLSWPQHLALNLGLVGLAGWAIKATKSVPGSFSTYPS